MNFQHFVSVAEHTKQVEALYNLYMKLHSSLLDPYRFTILDRSKDPDPYGLHGLSLDDRISAMTWGDILHE
jgi:hypothetical protein